MLKCPHHVQVESSPHVHSLSHKRPSYVPTMGPKYWGKNPQSTTKVTLTSQQQAGIFLNI